MPADRGAARRPEPRWLRWVVPAAVALAALGGWEAAVRIYELPQYLLPGPVLVGKTLWAHAGSLMASWWFTLKITLGALALAVLGGVLLGGLFAVSRWVELSLFPFAVVLQVTPVIAIAPLILIFVDSTTAALLLCAWIVAFFPILANTVVGLRSADARLRDLFRLYRATPWQTLVHLLVPSALPYFLAGLRVAAGLALVGAVVAEFTAGAAGRETGLASRILEASFRTEIPKMFAALVLVSLTGIALYGLTLLLSRWLLGRWHDSERPLD
ncbi:ABC transporter permease [Aquincola sp. MAHUQ-54]|uniref:ABC transporter permease n=1 Tax=Aquincola agrisoli TaxID=3119538 RepID=A0AAW9QPI8_9BURK